MSGAITITAPPFNFFQSTKDRKKPIKFSPKRFHFCRGDLIRREPAPVPVPVPVGWRKTQNSMKEVRANESDEGVEVFEQEAFVDGSLKFGDGGLEATLNTMSKWIVSALFGAVSVWRHDAEVLWAAMGVVLNILLSIELKKLVNQERPNSTLRSDPGMPSSHAQSIFYTFTFVNISMVELYGMNAVTATLSGFLMILAAYLSWLRVSQHLHTVIQVVVGAIIGTIFSIFWFWAWNAFMFNLFFSSLWVRSVVIIGAVACCLSFAQVIRTHMGEER